MNFQAKNMVTVPWLTLFYDLIVVAVIARASYIYGKNPTWLNFGFIAVSLLIVYILWSITTLELLLNQKETWKTRALIAIQVVALLISGLAMYRGGGISDRWGFFALAVAFTSVALLALSRRLTPHSNHRFSTSSSIFSLCAAAIFGVGSLFPMGYVIGEVLIAWIFYPLGAAVGLAGLVFAAPRLLIKPTTINAHQLNERFGVLLLIVLGDAFLQTLEVLGTQRTITSPLFLFLTILLVFSVWIQYFLYLANPPLARRVSLARARVVAHFLLVISTAFSIVALVRIADELGKEINTWSTLPLLFLVGSLLWLTVLQDERWTKKASIHCTTFLFLLALTIAGQQADALVKEIDFILANIAILCDVVVVYFLIGKDKILISSQD